MSRKKMEAVFWTSSARIYPNDERPKITRRRFGSDSRTGQNAEALRRQVLRIQENVNLNPYLTLYLREVLETITGDKTSRHGSSLGVYALRCHTDGSLFS